MGTPNFWLGRADATYHTFTITFATTATGTGTATITHGTKTVTHVYANTNTAIVIAAAVYAKLAASVIPEFTEISWTYTAGTAVITGTYLVAGVPGEVSASTSGGTGTTVAVVDVVAPSGPNFINVDSNFSKGLPVDGQDVIFNGGPACLYGFATSGWTGAPNVIWQGGFTEAFGLPHTRNPGSGTSYVEFRKRFFELPGLLNVVGIGDGAGPSLVNVTLVDTAHLRVFDTGPATEAGAVVNVFPVTGNAPARVEVFGGSVHIGWQDSVYDEGTTLTSLHVNGEDANVTVGRDITITGVVLNDGDLVLNCTIGANFVTQRGGTLTYADGLVLKHIMTGGVCNMDHYQADLDEIELNISANADEDPPTLDLSRTKLYKHFLDGYVRGGSVVNDPFGVAEYDNVSFDNASAKASTIGTGYNVSATPLT